MFSLPPSAASAPIYCLSQIVLQDGAIFFFDASSPVVNFWTVNADSDEDRRMILANHEGLKGYVILTNAAVIVSRSNKKTKSKITTWIDRRGYVHGLEVLDRQLAYNAWLNRLPATTPRAMPPSDDPTAPAVLEEIPATGIMDRRTLWLAYDRMRFQLGVASDNLRKLCRDAAGPKAPCNSSPWPNGAIQLAADTLEPARVALSAYAASLRTVPMAAAVPYAGKCDDLRQKWLVYAPEFMLLAHNTPEQRFHNEHFEPMLKGYAGFANRRYPGEPEDGVVEAADLAALDAGRARVLQGLEQEAGRRVAQAVMFLGDMD